MTRSTARPRRSRYSPRKKPRQERSVATVDAIIQAAAYILLEHGWSGFNTNAVADRARVNTAWLYPYLPNKDAIAAELKRRHTADLARAIGAVLAPGVVPPDETELLRRMIVATVREHSVDPYLDRI